MSIELARVPRELVGCPSCRADLQQRWLKYSGAMRVLGSLALGALTLALLPAAATAAKPSASTVAPYRAASFSLPGSNGFRIEVSGTETTHRLPNVFVAASKGHRYKVQYLAHGISTPSGTLSAKFPGLGRIDVRFEEWKVVHRAPPDNCTGPPNIVRRGFFRGTIRFRGEEGFTSVHRHSAPGRIIESFKQVCNGGELKGGNGPEVKWTRLDASRGTGPIAVNFTASRIEIANASSALTGYYMSAVTHHDGLTVMAFASAQGDPSGFVTTGTGVIPSDATVEPPTPFTGSATFHLDSPHSSSWTGTLGVELPGIGEVALAGSTFSSALCVGDKCTKTLSSTSGPLLTSE
jgi:hypothetical protein